MVVLNNGGMLTDYESAASYVIPWDNNTYIFPNTEY